MTGTKFYTREESKMTSNEKISVNGNKLIAAIGTEHVLEILNVMEIDLCDYDAWNSFCEECEWHCGVEDTWWPMTAYQLNLTDEYAVRWTYTDSAGIDDEEIIERVDDEEDQKWLAVYVREIAAGCGSCDGDVR